MVRLYWINFLFIVDELTAHSEDLDWDNINDIVTDLGQATGSFEEKRNFNEKFILAKIRCVVDSSCINTPQDIADLSFAIIPTQTEKNNSRCDSRTR
jgi:hypothetical protein